MTILAKIWIGIVAASAFIIVAVATHGVVPIIVGLYLLTVWSYGKWVNS